MSLRKIGSQYYNLRKLFSVTINKDIATNKFSVNTVWDIPELSGSSIYFSTNLYTKKWAPFETENDAHKFVKENFQDEPYTHVYLNK